LYSCLRYREDTRGWLDPAAFIEAHGGAPENDIGQLAIY
jgi:hypothetical protein